MLPTIILATIVISTAICHYYAKKKYLNSALWIILGACFGPLAIPFAMMWPSRVKEPSNQ